MILIFGEIRQNGYVVRDIDSALRHWTEVIRVGPFFLLRTGVSGKFHLPRKAIADRSQYRLGQFGCSAD
jgi:hypothetical protein